MDGSGWLWQAMQISRAEWKALEGLGEGGLRKACDGDFSKDLDVSRSSGKFWLAFGGSRESEGFG